MSKRRRTCDCCGRFCDGRLGGSAEPPLVPPEFKLGPEGEGNYWAYVCPYCDYNNATKRNPVKHYWQYATIAECAFTETPSSARALAEARQQEGLEETGTEPN